MDKTLREYLFRIRHISRQSRLFGAVLCAIFMTVTFVVPQAQAAQTVPYKMNFQGRLTDSSGQPMPNGLYNMKFRIYDAATAGTLKWSETRETVNRVQITGGLFSTQLGDVTGLPPAIFTTQNLYFEIELPTPATVTCSTTGCASYAEGPMTPRNKLGSSAYALNADQVDGIDGSSLARKDAANTFTSANTFSAATTFNSSVTVGSTNSPTKFVVNDNVGTALLTADTSATIVKVGTSATATLSNVRLLSTSAEFSGTVRIGSATNGVDISSTGVILSGTARPIRTINFSPEYAGATFTADGTNNDGALSSDFCSPASLLNVNATSCNTDASAGSARSYNFYKWVTTQASAQDYDIYVRAKLPSDYSAGSLANLTFWGYGASAAADSATIAMYSDASGTPCTTSSDVANITNAWNKVVISAPLGACTLSAGSSVTFKISLVTTSSSTGVTAGDFSYDYRGAN